MTVNSLSALRRIEQTRRLQQASLVLTGAGFAACMLQTALRHRPQDAAKPIVQQALAVCTALGNDCELDGTPRFGRENIPLSNARPMERPLWSVPLRASGRHYVLILRGDTKRLCSLFEIPDWKPEHSIRREAEAFTAEQAVNQSLRVMQRWKLAAPDAQIALASRPALAHSPQGWRITWNVRPSSKIHASEPIRLVLSRRDGHPIVVINTAALTENPL